MGFVIWGDWTPSGWYRREEGLGREESWPEEEDEEDEEEAGGT